MLEILYHYDGMGKPQFAKDVHWFFELGVTPKYIAMDQDEHHYLSALQFMHGKEVKIIHFQDFHDYGWANQKQNPLDLYLAGVCCSIDFLTDLMASPHGDLRWKRELERRERVAVRLRNNPPSLQGIFI